MLLKRPFLNRWRFPRYRTTLENAEVFQTPDVQEGMHAMDLSVAIVDDMQDDRARLSADVQALLAQKGCACSLTVYTSAEEFLSSPSCETMDIAFLDVRMGGMNGIELATRLRDIDSSVVIVFVTSSREYALDAFPTHPFDYLVKPYTKERLDKLLDDVLDTLRIKAEQKTITVDVPYGNVEVPLDNLVAIVAQSHSSLLTLADGQEIRSTMSFANAHALVASDSRFLMINRGVVINMDRVVSMEGATVVIEGGLRMPLRKRDRGELSRTITQHMIMRAGRRYRG